MLTVRHIDTAADGTERELWAVPVPRAIEAQGPDAVIAYVAQHAPSLPEVVSVPATDLSPAEES